MENEKISLIILSCDKNSFLWPGFFKLLDKYWPNHPSRVILSTETKVYNNNSIIMSNNRCLNENWSSRFYHAICEAGTEFVIVMLDDFYIKSNVNETKVNKYIEIINTDLKISMISFENQPDCIEKNKYSNEKLLKRKKFSSYRINAQPGIWRSSYLKNILRNGENPWQFELSGTFRSFFMKGDLYAVGNEEKIIPTDKGWLVVRGELNKKLVEYYLKKENIDLSAQLEENNIPFKNNKKKSCKIVRIIGYCLECIKSLTYKKIKE